MGYIGEFSNPIPLSINNKIISYYAHDDPILSDNIWNQTLWDQSYHRNLTSLFSDNFYFDLYMRHNDFSIYFTIVMKEVRLTQIYLSSDDYHVDAEASAPFNDLVLEITQTGVETQFSTTGFWQDLQPTFQQPEQEIIYQSDFSVFEFSLPYSYFKDVTLDSGSDILNFGFYWFGNNYWFGNQITGGGYGSAEGIINLNVGDNDTQGAFQIISHPSTEIDKYYNPYISWEIQPEIYIYQINLNDRYEFFGKILNSILNIDLTSVEDGIYNLTLTVTTKNGNSSMVDYVINVFSSPSTAVSTISDILPSTTSYSTLSSDKTDSNINEEGPELPINLPYPNSVFVTLIFISVMSIIQKRKN